MSTKPILRVTNSWGQLLLRKIDTIFWSEYLSTVTAMAIIHTEVIKSQTTPSTTLCSTGSSHDAAEVIQCIIYPSNIFPAATDTSFVKVIFSYAYDCNSGNHKRVNTCLKIHKATGRHNTKAIHKMLNTFTHQEPVPFFLRALFEKYLLSWQ